MIKTFSKKFWITLISVPVIGTGIILACADGGGPDEYGNSSFTPEAFADSSYRPFFYAEYWNYYDIGYDNRHDTRFNETNVTEWAKYLNASPDELTFLLNTAPSSTIDSIAGWLNGKIKILPVAVQGYKLLNKKNAAFINYLQQAKKCEAFAVNNLEYAWDYESKQKVNVNTTVIDNALMQGYTNSKDAFLKQRYWFQVVRSYYFNGPPQTAIDFFEKNEKQFPKNTLYYRSMAYAAGAYYKLKIYSKANYYYSKVYDGCAPLKTVTHYSFHPQEESDWKATLALCANNDEKATLWQMLGVFYADEKRSIQEIYALNPRSEKLNLLLTRAVNKEEQKYSIWDGRYMRDELRLTRDSINLDLLSLVTSIAEAGNTEKPFMWQIAAGYLNMLNGNLQKASAWYASAEKKLPKEELVQNQLRLLKLMNTIASSHQVNSQLENKVLKDIGWLRTMNNSSNTVFRRTGAFEWVKRAMANRYLQQKDYIKSVCFVNYPDFYTNNRNVEAMKAFLDKTNKTPYEQLCASLYTMSKADLLEYQAISQAFNDNMVDAIAKMESSGNNSTLPGNPFNGRLHDCHDCDHAAPQKIKYTKLMLLKKMKDMEDKIKVNEDVYNHALLLANAFYNMTHYGNARAFYECNVIGSSHYSPTAIDSAFLQPLTSMTLATKYYTIALNAAKNDEQKARCHFMLAKCERNQWYNETVYTEGYHFKAWNGFTVLKQQYANTQYYREAIKECGYFRTYVNKLR